MLFLSVRAEETGKGTFPEHADNIRLLLPINRSSNTSDQSFTFSFQTAFSSALKLEPGRKSSAGTLEDAKHTDLTCVCYCAVHKNAATRCVVASRRSPSDFWDFGIHLQRGEADGLWTWLLFKRRRIIHGVAATVATGWSGFHLND